MGGTVVANLTLISNCDQLTGWTAVGGTNTLNDPTVFDQIQGSYCIQNYSASAVDRGSDYALGATDLSNTCLYFWFAFSKKTFQATNPMRIRLTDASGNWREWNIFTKATLPHPAWIAWALNTTAAYDAQSATPPTMTAITIVGWRCAAVVAKVYIYFDAWRYGTGLTIKLGTEGSPATFEDLYLADVDSANAYGVIDKFNGIYFLQGQIKIGSTTAGESSYFKDTNQIVVFKSIKGNPTGFYLILGQGNSTGTTKIFLGTKSGTAGISGCVIKATTEKFTFTMSDTYITEFGFYGCIFLNPSTITGQAYSTLKEFLSCSIMAGAEMLPNTGIVKSCKFISSSAEAVRMINTSCNIDHCDFITCSRGVHIPAIGTYSFNALSFSGCTYDVKNSSVGLVTVNYDSLCSPPPSTHEETGGGTTVIQTSITLTVRHVKTGSEPTNYVRCAIYKASDMTEIMNMDATVADDQNAGYYKASMSYTVAGISVKVRAREKGYLPFETGATITSNGLDVTAVWIVDPNYVP